MSIFASRVMAGFECGFLGWNGHDLLRSTGHVPEERMRPHYAAAAALGIGCARDGLPWRHDPASRLQVASQAGFQVVWDLNHYDPPPDPVAHACRAVLAADPDAPLWLCPVNEPSLYPLMCGMPREEATELAKTLARAAQDSHSDVRFLTTDPIVGAGAHEYVATDVLVSAGLADVVGVNYYPHTAVEPLRDVLLATWRRYGKPVLLAETSFHNGHPDHEGRFGCHTKADWFRHVSAEIAAAEASGARVEGLCWYPFVDCPEWESPSGIRWSHGALDEGMNYNGALAAEIQRLSFAG